MEYDVIVAGGGAAGMMAAGSAAQRGARVLLFERNGRLGVKLRITGKGRCNITNSGPRDQFIRSYGANGPFLYRALTEFSSDDLIAFFEGRGVAVKTERGGRVFPVTDDAGSVVDALARYLDEAGVEVRLGSRVQEVVTSAGTGGSSSVQGVRLLAGGLVRAPSVILATGGMTYPRTGSTGDGYRIAENLGHGIITPRPALVPLETEESRSEPLEGLTLKNVRCTAYADGREIGSEFGELSFEPWGVSGPVILTMSGDIVEHRERKEAVRLSIDLKPALDHETLTRRLQRELDAGNRALAAVLETLLPRALVPAVIRRSGVPAQKKSSQVARRDRETIERLLKDFRLIVTRARPPDEAIVTRGGIDLADIEPRTLESRRVRGLFLCGEVIDIDARTGGYNLQAAFSTGYLAGTAAAGKKIR